VFPNFLVVRACRLQERRSDGALLPVDHWDIRHYSCRFCCSSRNSRFGNLNSYSHRLIGQSCKLLRHHYKPSEFALGCTDCSVSFATPMRCPSARLKPRSQQQQLAVGASKSPLLAVGRTGEMNLSRLASGWLGCHSFCSPVRASRTDVCCRPHLQSQCGAGRNALDVDIGLRAARGSIAHARLRGDPRGSDGSIR
jgi:hypothetical protein